MAENVPESLEVQPAVLSFLLAPGYHIHSLLVVFSEGRVHGFCPLSRESLYITVLYVIAIDSQKAGWSFSLRSLMSKFSSEVARNGSLASRGRVHPLIAQILCSQWQSHQWCRWQTPWAHSISMLCHSVQTNLSFRKMARALFCTKRKKTHECHLLSFVFSWLMLEFLFLTCTCKPILPRYKLFWFFTTITSCSSCLDCWRSSMILMSILWEAAFPWVSFYTLQGYLYTF